MLNPYEDRYRRVYAAGARFWSPPVPTEELADFIRDWKIPEAAKVIEFGCGEGRDSIFLAKSGFDVTAIDNAPSAIQRAKERANEEGINANFIVSDVTDLTGIPDNSYDLGVNIACLHMFPRYEDRRRHLSEAFRVLNHKAIFYLLNMAVLEKAEISKEFGENWEYPKVGELTPRIVIVDGKEKKILLPIVEGHQTTKEEITKEIGEVGFELLQIERRKTKPQGICWIVVARKPDIC